MARTKRQQYEKRFFLSLFIAVLCLFAAVGIYNFERKKNTPESLPDISAIQPEIAKEPVASGPDQLSVVSGIVYRHLIAYNLVCTESGQPLKKYPEYFSRKYTDEIRRIDEAWARRGKSLEAVLTDYDSHRYPKIAPEIQTELIGLERKIAILVKAQKAGVTPDKIAWTQEDENKLNVKDACWLFDDTAAEIGETADFAKYFKEFMKGI